MKKSVGFFCLKRLLSLWAALFFCFSPAWGNELAYFPLELGSFPIPLSTVAEFKVTLNEFKEGVPPNLRVDNGPEALRQFIDERLETLTLLLTELDKKTLSAEESSYAEVLKSLLNYYRNYRVDLKELEDVPKSADAPRFGSLSSSIYDYNAMRLAIHRTFTDIKGDYILLSKISSELQHLLRTRKREEKTRNTTPLEQAKAELEDIDFATHTLELETCVKSIQEGLILLEQQKTELQRIGKSLSFKESELSVVLKELDLQEEDAKKRQQLFYVKKEQAEDAYYKERVTSGSVEQKDIVSLSDSSVSNSRLAKNYIEYVVYGQRYDMYQNSMQRIQLEKELWRKRFELYSGLMSDEKIWETRGNVVKSIKTLSEEKELEEFLFQSNYSIALQRLKSKRDRASGEVRNNLEAALFAIEEILTEVARDYSLGQRQSLLLFHAFQEELDSRLKGMKYVRQIGAFWQETAGDIWNAVLWEGDRYTITVRKLVWALFIFLLGGVFSQRASRAVEHRLKGSFGRSETLSILFRHIVFYSLLCAFFLIALKIVRVPLTAFAFIGGGIVVGLSVGMKDIVANLIGGVIITGTRLFKLRDIVEVGGHTGYIAEISSRATVLNCYDGTEVMVPNQHFLEHSFVNWTRKTRFKRISVDIPTSLDADVEEVKRLVLGISQNDKDIAQHPDPEIYLKSCSHTGLLFTLRYWVDAVDKNIPVVSGRVLAEAVRNLKAKGWLCRWGGYPQ